MAVKDGLPATDFSRQNREWVRNVAEGESVPDGLPATDFSRMNREWVKAVAAGGGGGGSITVEPLTVTENGTYTADEGKAYSPVTVDVAGGGGGDFTTTEVTVISGPGIVQQNILNMPNLFTYEDFNTIMPDILINPGETVIYTVPLYKGSAYVNNVNSIPLTVSGNITAFDEIGYSITGNCTITAG